MGFKFGKAAFQRVAAFYRPQLQLLSSCRMNRLRLKHRRFDALLPAIFKGHV
ncbi:hypothetical protein [Bartonella apihabitans]|uniref:hypothetical protein n=1 Tax=Bartonella apihabitans TaxID=2750929 RepID=UPI003BB643AE